MRARAGENGVTGAEARVGLEEVDSPLNVVGLDPVPPDELGDVANRLCRARAVSGAARSLVNELLK